MHDVTLSWSEAAMAIEVGCMRQVASLKAGRQDAHGMDKEGWSEHIEGACGELALAKHLGVYWDGAVDTFGREDLPGGIQVKTRSQHHYDLLVRLGDRDDHRFVLVTGRCPNYTVRGWILGRDAKRPEYLKDYANRAPAYFVPKEKLHCPSNLRSPSPS